MHNFEDLIMVFNACFEASHNTRLVRGGDEPIYEPANASQPWHAIYFARGYFSSALHECAHWLVAGAERRQQTDYGYWYIPDGRTPEQQALFQQVEVKPQALEWILSVACGYAFQFSFDNLSGEEADTQEFKQAIYAQVIRYINEGLPPRAAQFRKALCRFYGTTGRLSCDQFDAEKKRLLNASHIGLL